MKHKAYMRERERKVAVRFLRVGGNKKNLNSLLSILKGLLVLKRKLLIWRRKKENMGMNKNKVSDMNIYNIYYA